MNGVGANISVSLSFLQVSSTAFIMLMRTITVLNNRDSGHIASDNPLLLHWFSISPVDTDFTTMEFIFVHLVLRQETP